jgi:carbon storage regulator
MPNLILSRREGETVVIDEKITIRFLEVDGKSIRLSIEAPREVNIRRGELPIRESDTTS